MVRAMLKAACGCHALSSGNLGQGAAGDLGQGHFRTGKLFDGFDSRDIHSNGKPSPSHSQSGPCERAGGDHESCLQTRCQMPAACQPTDALQDPVGDAT